MTGDALVLVDTSVWIEFLHRPPGPSAESLRRLIESGKPLAITGVILTEILQGLSRDVDLAESYLSQWDVLEPRGRGTYVEAARHYRRARASGITPSTVDILIAAIAIENHAMLFTLDRDFLNLARVVPLKIYSPTI